MACLMLAWFAPMRVYAEELTTTQPDTVIETQDATDPKSAEASPANAEPQPTYTYDSTTGRWNTGEWQYDANSNTYVPTPPPVVNQQEPTPILGGLETPAESSTSTTQNVGTSTSITNALTSLAETGDAGVLANGTGGNALTGDATAIATIINNVNSTVTNSNNKEAATFVSDIMGDVNGDILLQPMLLKAMMEANALQTQAGLQVNNTTGITNNITLDATSGDANVESNTKAGDATTGSANTVADVVNIVNSMVAANQSFVGTINIYGNLNGDILIAPDFIPQLIESNGLQVNDVGATKVNTTDTQTIINNVALAAESGAALVGNNTIAGSAQSGNADTNLVIFNLSGHEIVASNSLLVFVNVLGTWVGIIVDAPTGSTAAAIADNVSTNNRISPSLEVDIVNDTALTNNLVLNSKSGNATVLNNTLAGSARSGSATASANIANISNSQLGLTGWFGVLFINVFGSWIGSFGVDTAAGNSTVLDSPQVAKAGEPVKIIQFVPHYKPAQPVKSAKVITPQTDGITQVTELPAAQSTAQTSARDGSGGPLVSDIPTQESYITNRSVNVPLGIGSLVLTTVSIYALRRFII
jgi:hypothetical protein